MGVVNVTPDSFSDGGLFLDADAAVEHGRRLAAEGADDPRRGRRVHPPGCRAGRGGRGAAARAAASSSGSRPAGGARISIDTTKVAVARAALSAGATHRQRRVRVPLRPRAWRRWWPRRGADCCLMHMLGEPRTMQEDPRYDDVVSEVKAFLEERLAFAVGEGVAEERVWLDPGHRLRQDRRAQPRAAAPARRDRRDRPAGRGRHVAQELPRQARRRPRRGRAPARDDRHERARARARGDACSACTTSPRTPMPSRWPLLLSGRDVGEGA